MTSHKIQERSFAEISDILYPPNQWQQGPLGGQPWSAIRERIHAAQKKIQDPPSLYSRIEHTSLFPTPDGYCCGVSGTKIDSHQPHDFSYTLYFQGQTIEVALLREVINNK